MKFNTNTTQANSCLNQFKFLHFAYFDFTLVNFTDAILTHFQLNTTYSILLKISSDNNLTFKMCGPQIGLTIQNEHNLDYYSKLFELIKIRIETTLEEYSYIESIEGLEIMYSVIIPQKELKLKNINNYSFNKPLVNDKETKKNFNQNLLPFTLDTSYYGIKVQPKDRQTYTQLILINNLNTKIPGCSVAGLDDKFKIKESDNLFLYDSPNNRYKLIIVSRNLDDNNFLRYIFERETGIFLKFFKDSIICSKTQLFTRSIGNISLTLDNKILKQYTVKNELKPITKDITQIKPAAAAAYKIGSRPALGRSNDRNINFGTFDLETFKDDNGLAKVYALGFYTKLETSPNIFYITDYPELVDYPENLILKCLNEMLINKYNNYIFYAHNLSGYDVIFLYNTLLNYNLKLGYDYYQLKTTMRDNTIIKLDIKIKQKGTTQKPDTAPIKIAKPIKISFVDSLNLLNYSLDNLTKDLNPDLRKGNFPHSFVNTKTFNYKGLKPNKIYFEGISDEEYKLIPKTNWDLRSECLTYLNKDILSLFTVINEFSRLIYIHFNVQVTDALTITRLALNIFKKNYYFNINIPSINKIYLFNFIKEAYFGGITEVYKPYGKDLIYIDVNSLYPFAALNSLPGTHSEFIESFEDNGLELENLFGFFYCKIKTNNHYLGLLPVYFDGQVIFPNGEYFGVWCSEELKYAKEKGYEIIVYKGYNFNKIDNIFNTYILELFQLKQNSSGLLKLIYKSLLNNLLGRFGLNIIKPITQTVSKEKRDFIFSTREIKSQTILNENKFLITYNPIVSKEICLQHGLEVIKVLEKESKLNIENQLDLFKDVSIATSAFVTSYARIFMNKTKLEILDNGGEIYYSDTDSIVLNKNYFNPDWISNEIGFFKLEYDIKEAFFISNKTYCLVLQNGNCIIKTKGIINNSINIEDFKQMYWHNQNIKATKVNTVTSYKDASVLIEKKEVTLNYDVFKKREKVYNKDNIWIDTKPLNLNT